MTLLVVAAVGVLVALAVGDALRSGRSSSSPATAPTTTTGPPPSLSAEEIVDALSVSDRHEIRQTGFDWAQRFAAARTRSSCFHMEEPFCSQVYCARTGFVDRKTCTPPTPAYRKSFKGATVQAIESVLEGTRAAVTFSNGEVVELYTDGGAWWIRKLIGNPIKEEIERIGNRWAQRFGSGNSCFGHMSQPLCERIDCAHVGGVRIKNCTPLTAAFQESFEEATVQDIVIRGYRAAAMFSNGEVITLHGDTGTWWIEKLGGNAARQFFE
jgi:hypothetical protein